MHTYHNHKQIKCSLHAYIVFTVQPVFIANLNHYFTQDILMKERLSYNDQLDEQSTPLAKKDQLNEELRKKNEVHNYNYVCS